MSNELAATADTILFSNVTVVRDQEGNLSFWVGNEKALGVAAVQIQGGILSLAMPMSRARLAEDVPATPVVVDKSNVLEFKNFRKAQLVVDNTDVTPPTDGAVA
jgi:hypothetical protein